MTKDASNAVKSPMFKKLSAKAKRDPSLAARLREGCADIRVLLEDPFSPLADQVIQKTVDRYNADAFVMVAVAGVIHHPFWPRWHRLLQVRFIQLACADRPQVAAAVRKELEGEQRHCTNKLMGEVFRQCIIETFAWGKANKDNPRADKASRPRGPEQYWKDAIETLDQDMAIQLKAGKLIDQAPPEWYSILGNDYSLSAVPN